MAFPSCDYPFTSNLNGHQFESVPSKVPKNRLLCTKDKLCNAFLFSPVAIENLKKERAQEFGLSPCKDRFLQNQSFPSAFKSPENGNGHFEMGEMHKCTIDKFKGDSLNSFSFSPPVSKNNFASPEYYRKRHLSGSWLFYRYIDSGRGNNGIHVSVQNPNKAIVTINARTTEILVVNKLASNLLAIKENFSTKKRLCDYILSKKDQYSLTEIGLELSGNVVHISGKVMDLIICKNGKNSIVPVSVWARRVEADDEPRCVVVMEPVERIMGSVELDSKGKVLRCDKNFAMLYGYPKPEDIEGFNIKDLIPSLELLPENKCGSILPEDGLKQCATGRTRDGSTFPLSIKIAPSFHEAITDFGESDHELSPDEKIWKSTIVYKGTVWVFNNISGMVTLLSDGTIHSCNTNFSLMLFGYSQNELKDKNITILIPTFYDDIEFLDTDSMALPPLDDDEDDSNAKCCCTSDGRTTADSNGTDPPRPMNPIGKHVELMIDDAVESMQNLVFTPSPSDAPLSFHYNQYSPCLRENPELEDAHIERTYDKENSDVYNEVPKEELSESSSQHRPSLKQLSFSESQDTLHSGTNSITESDVNANVLEMSDCDDSQKNPGMKKIKLTINKSHKDSYCSDSSDGEESLSSLADDFGSFNKRIDDIDHLSSVNVPNTLQEVSCQTEDYDCKNKCCEREEISSHSRLSHYVSEHELCPYTYPIKASTPRDTNTHAYTSHNSDDSYQSIPEGVFYGIGRHKDGTDLAIEYHIKKIELVDGKYVYCLWIMRDAEEAKPLSQASINLNATSYTTSHSSTTTDQSGSQESEQSSSGESDSAYTMGTFVEKYTVLQQIGKGAFGCVKKAYRNSDGLLVIAKFIRKSDVYKELWVFDNVLKCKVPLEISLLYALKHPNIVRVLEVFENDNYFQMIMEKHGSGMDLFEFIERNPNLDEPLASYIFRQVVSALRYLHGLSIIHRDIKDENIILDENFQVKLIDFGSATFMDKEPFSTFCGTMEYCSPEVIQGNKYRGPELEMWALGVTLYTLIFGENPFIDVEETLKAEVKIPCQISEDLKILILHLLDPNPQTRCTLIEVYEHPWTTQPVEIENYRFSEVVNASAEEINPPKYISEGLIPCEESCQEANASVGSSNCTDSETSNVTENLACINLCSQPNTLSGSESDSNL